MQKLQNQYLTPHAYKVDVCDLIGEMSSTLWGRDVRSYGERGGHKKSLANMNERRALWDNLLMSDSEQVDL